MISSVTMWRWLGQPISFSIHRLADGVSLLFTGHPKERGAFGAFVSCRCVSISCAAVACAPHQHRAQASTSVVRKRGAVRGACAKAALLSKRTRRRASA